MRKLLAPALLATSMLLSMPLAALSDDSDTQLTETEAKEAIDFIYGNATFVLLHESGHMLISELQLPVLGREEDAVDTLSSILLLEAHDEALDKAITDSADGWFLSDEAREAAGGDLAFWDTHGLDKQRAYQMVCMMVGQDAEGFKDFADSVDFPADRREECAGEYQKALQSWNALLSPHALAEGETNHFDVSYEEAGPELAPYEKMLKDARVMEGIADIFSGLYKLNDGIHMVAGTCGQPNAFWMPEKRTLVYCYELAAYHDQLISKWLLDHRNDEDQTVSDASAATEDAESQDTSGDSDGDQQ